MAERSSGKVAIVTGAGKGIGRAIARRLAEDGAAVVAADRDRALAADTAGAIQRAGGTAAELEVEVASAEGRRRMLAAAADRFGRLDILVNNAGIMHVNRPERVTETEWDDVLAVNCKAVFFACVEARPYLVKAGGGRIVNIASVAGKRPAPWWVPYGVSKAGVISLTRSLAVAFAQDGILVNCVCPGPIKTDMWAGMNAEGTERIGLPSGEFERLQIDLTPLRRFGRAEDVAAVVAFLCSPDSGHMTGQAVNVDGGMIFY